MTAIPPMSDMLRLAEKPPRKRALLPNQVTFPIYRDEQWNRLRRLMFRKGVIPTKCRFSPEGMQIGFDTGEDAMLIKMAFDPR